jgi:HEPN domain-containing protein
MNDDVRDAVRQWCAKAESDWTTVQVLLGAERRPADVVCFHCQQYVEKLLKGLLTLHGIEAPKTHDLRRLVQLAESLAPELSPLIDRADALTAHSIQSRYPDEWHEIKDAEMRDIVEAARTFASALLPRLQT